MTIIMKQLNEHMELIKTIAKVEYTRLSQSFSLVDYSELVNIGVIAVHVMLTTHKNTDFNASYMATGIKWAIRNELRRRYKWHGYRHLSSEKMVDSDNLDDINRTKIREAIYETILSLDDPDSWKSDAMQMQNQSYNPEENFELNELNKAIRDAMKKLPPRHKLILENRFIKGIKIKDLADEYKVTSSRITRIIQSGLDKIKNELAKQGFI